MNVFACLDLSGTEAELLREIVSPDQLHLRPCINDDAPIDTEFPKCEVCFGNPPASWIESSRNLRWVQLESVGFGEYLELPSKPVFTNLAGFFGEPVAQSALGGILALYRGIGKLVTLRDRQEWLGDGLRPELRSLGSARVLLFGQGAINGRLAQLLAPFGCTVKAMGRGWRSEELERALGSVDILVSAVPDMPVTRGVFDRGRLALMPAQAIVVNLGRGSVLDENALADALESGHLAGAVIDVTNDEPLPTQHRFWQCPNLILTQHTGGGSGDEMNRKIERFAANLGKYRAGQELIGTVDFAKGY